MQFWYTCEEFIQFRSVMKFDPAPLKRPPHNWRPNFHGPLVTTLIGSPVFLN